MKTIVFWIVILISAALLWNVVQQGGKQPGAPEIPFSEFMQKVEADEVTEVTLLDHEVRGSYKGGKGDFYAQLPSQYPEMVRILREHGVTIRVKRGETSSLSWIIQLAPLILFGALWFLMIRQMQRKQTPPDHRNP